jgi:hypothetical protein
MQIIKPNSDNQTTQFRPSVFLAGSIEMGAAEDWQVRIEKELQDLSVTVFNPRRDDWDSSWTQEQSNPQFNAQVNWEMNRLDECDVMFMYFSPETKSPISLLELGAYGAHKYSSVVCCPPGFWRRGNVEIFCTRHNIPMFDTLEEAIGALRTKISSIR